MLIFIDFRSDWSVQFKDFDYHDFVKKNDPTHILFMKNVIRGEEFNIISDILDSGEFNLSTYDSRWYS